MMLVVYRCSYFLLVILRPSDIESTISTSPFASKVRNWVIKKSPSTPSNSKIAIMKVVDIICMFLVVWFSREREASIISHVSSVLSTSEVVIIPSTNSIHTLVPTSIMSIQILSFSFNY